MYVYSSQHKQIFKIACQVTFSHVLTQKSGEIEFRKSWVSRVVTWVQIACQPENGYGNLDLILLGLIGYWSTAIPDELLLLWRAEPNFSPFPNHFQ